MLHRLLTIPKTWRFGHYLSFSLLVVLVFFVVIELRNWELLRLIYGTSGSWIETGRFAVTMLGGLTTLFSPIGSLIIVLFAILFSLNAVLLYQYIILQRTLTKRSGGKGAVLSTAGTIAAALGIGCASCGTAIIFSLLSLFGASGLILWLPLHGQEFAIVGLAGSAYFALKLLYKNRPPDKVEWAAVEVVMTVDLHSRPFLFSKLLEGTRHFLVCSKCQFVANFDFAVSLRNSEPSHHCSLPAVW